MTCDRCDECRAEGSRYCAYCGADLKEDCPMCQSQRDNGSRYCTFCGKNFCEQTAGYPEEPVAKKESVPLIKKITAVMMPSIAILLIIEAGCMLWGIGDVWNWCATGTMRIYGLVPQLVTLTKISGLTLQIAWILIVIAIMASLILLTKQSLPSVKDRSKDAAERITGTPLYTVGVMFGAMLALDVIIMGIQALFGSTVETPEGMDTGRTALGLLQFADAAVWEEVIARIVPIGVPMAVAALILKRRDAPKMLLGGFGMSKLAIVLIVISSFMFGFAHESGWGIAKILPTLASGFLFGYLYVKIGVHASIAMHFLTDYLYVATDTSLVFLVGLLTVVVFCVGFVCLLQILLGMRGSKDKILALPNWVPAPQDNMLFRSGKD